MTKRQKEIFEALATAAVLMNQERALDNEPCCTMFRAVYETAEKLGIEDWKDRVHRWISIGPIVKGDDGILDCLEGGI